MNHDERINRGIDRPTRTFLHEHYPDPTVYEDMVEITQLQRASVLRRPITMLNLNGLNIIKADPALYGQYGIATVVDHGVCLHPSFLTDAVGNRRKQALFSGVSQILRRSAAEHGVTDWAALSWWYVRQDRIIGGRLVRNAPYDMIDTHTNQDFKRLAYAAGDFFLRMADNVSSVRERA